MATKKKAAKKGGAPARDLVDDLIKATFKAAEVRVHELKSWPSQFAATIAGVKPFEIRYNDRGFVVGERIRLREWQPLGPGDKRGVYSGRELLLAIKRIDEGFTGVRDGFVAMTVEPVVA